MPMIAGKQVPLNGGLGLMRLTMPDFALPDEKTFALLHAAVAHNITLWSAAEHYGTAENNSLHLLHRYFSAHPADAAKVVLTIKVGFNRAQGAFNASPTHLRRRVEYAEGILAGTKKIDVIGLARVVADTPVEDSVRELDALRREGRCQGVMLSEVRAETLRRAAAVAKVDCLESEASLWSPEVFENGVAAACHEGGTVLVAHTPLGHGMLAGAIKTLQDLPSQQYRALPRFRPETFERNRALVVSLEEMAGEKDCTVAQLALSWLRAMSAREGMPAVLPVAGARSEARMIENANQIYLSEEDMATIDLIRRDHPTIGYRTVEMMKGVNEY